MFVFLRSLAGHDLVPMWKKRDNNRNVKCYRMKVYPIANRSKVLQLSVRCLLNVSLKDFVCQSGFLHHLRLTGHE